MGANGIASALMTHPVKNDGAVLRDLVEVCVGCHDEKPVLGT